MELGKLYWEIVKKVEGKEKFGKNDKLPNITLRLENDMVVAEVPFEYESKLSDIESVLKNYKHKIVVLPKPAPNLEEVVYSICSLLKSKNMTNEVIDEFLKFYENTYGNKGRS